MNEYTFESSNAGDFRMAMAAAAKNDTRHYLNGVYIEPSKGMVTGADGHRLVNAVFADAQDAPNFIVKFDKPMPINTDKFYLTLETEDCHVKNGQAVDGIVMLYCHTVRGRETIIRGGLIAGEFPEYERVIPDFTEGKAIPSVGFNPLLVADLVKAKNGKFPGCRFDFNPEGAAGAIKVTINGSDARVVVMPMRLD